MSFYKLAHTVVGAIVRPYYSLEIIGHENIPTEGGVLICSNHISNWDPPVLGTSMKRPIHFMAKEELFKTTFLNKLMSSLKAFPVKRGGADREALRKGLQILKDGGVLGLFPEGTRSKTGELGKGQAGAGFFALKSTAKVVPAAIIGSYKRRAKLKMVYGRPIDFAPLGEKPSAEQVTDFIMSHIQQLLDEHRPS